MLVRRLARPMLAAVFIGGGVNALRDPGPQADAAEPVAPPAARAFPLPLPEDPHQLVRIDAGVKIVAGLALATGRLPRLASLVLAGSLVPTTLAAHRFWEANPADRENQLQHFLKNVGLLGGLLVAAVDTGGAPSLGWRARRAARTAAASGATTVAAARRALPVG